MITEGWELWTPRGHGWNVEAGRDRGSADLDQMPGDGPSGLYIDRCQYYIDNPPEKDWNQVFVMKTK